jgi:CRISPR/Cas system CSM-associated protein Csm2 small subunit
MKKNVVNELNEMKYLFGYERGRVISEQKEVPMEEDVDFDVMNDE